MMAPLPQLRPTLGGSDAGGGPLSVVVPTYNSAATLANTLDTIQKQLPPGAELLVIDGGSTDETLEIVAKFAPVVSRIISEADEGPYDAMNKGICFARGDIVAILNSDDLWLPGTVATVLEKFRHGGERLDIVHGNARYYSADGVSRLLRPAHGMCRQFGLGLPIIHPTMFVRRTVYERVGLYDCSYPICADQEFAYRCLRSGIRDTHVDCVLTEMLAGGLSSRVDYRSEIRRMIETFPSAQKWVARYLWRGLNENVSYFNGTTDTPALCAIAEVARRKVVRALRALASKYMRENGQG